MVAKRVLISACGLLPALVLGSSRVLADSITVDFLSITQQTTSFQQSGLTVTGADEAGGVGTLDFQGDDGLGIAGGSTVDGQFGLNWVDSGESVTFAFDSGSVTDVILTWRNSIFSAARDSNAGTLTVRGNFATRSFETHGLVPNFLGAPLDVSAQVEGQPISSITRRATTPVTGTLFQQITFVPEPAPSIQTGMAVAVLAALARLRRRRR